MLDECASMDGDRDRRTLLVVLGAVVLVVVVVVGVVTGSVVVVVICAGSVLRLRVVRLYTTMWASSTWNNLKCG